MTPPIITPVTWDDRRINIRLKGAVGATGRHSEWLALEPLLYQPAVAPGAAVAPDGWRMAPHFTRLETVSWVVFITSRDQPTANQLRRAPLAQRSTPCAGVACCALVIPARLRPHAVTKPLTDRVNNTYGIRPAPKAGEQLRRYRQLRLPALPVAREELEERSPTFVSWGRSRLLPGRKSHASRHCRCSACERLV